ncbi:MAG: hypothetical protein R3F49_10110 [Planctomycetota bacterium]
MLAATALVACAAGCGGGAGASAVTSEREWRALGTAVVPGRTMLPRLEASSASGLLCSFQDRTAGANRGSVVRYDAAAQTWRYLGAAGAASVGTDWWGAVQAGSAGVLYRANRDYGFANDGLGFWRYDPGTASWAPFGSQPLSVGEAHYIDLELDTSGRPVLAFQDGTTAQPAGPGSGGALTVLRIDPGSGAATALGGAAFTRAFTTPSDATHGDLAVSANGTLWAAWIEHAQGGEHPRVARFDAGPGTWTLVGSPANGLPNIGSHVAIAVDSTGRPLIAFRGNGPLRFLVYRMDLGTLTWSQVGADISASQLSGGAYPGFSVEAGYRERTPFAVGPADGLYLSHLAPDASQVDRVKVFSFRGGAWLPLGSTGFLPGTEQEDYTSLAVISEGGVEVPFVTCRRAPLTANERLVGYAFR